MQTILQALYFMLPAYLANMAPVFAQKLVGDYGATPIDLGKTYKGQPLFGSHKTYRGFIVGIAAAIVMVHFQKAWLNIPFFWHLSILPYATLNVTLYGFLFGFGALLGDLVKSFFKRRVHVQPGKPWLPWDQVDFSLGTLAILAPLYIPSWPYILVIVLVSPVLSFLANRIGFFLKIKNTKW